MRLQERQNLHYTEAPPLQVLRTPAGIPAEVRDLPVMFPAVGAARGNSRSFEVILVSMLFVVGRQSFATS